jgi:heptosyltransferase-2
MENTNILVWLPSPMGDAILCTPALRAIRRHFKSARISFLANAVDREILSPCHFNDTWLEQKHRNPLAIAKMLRGYKFTHSILFKNSFASALAVFLAAIPLRIGYAREGRSVLLTDRLYPPKLPDGRFKPISMIDYYLAITSWLGADTTDRSLELTVDPQKQQNLRSKLPELVDCEGPIVILVPGGAFGPSKCWPAERFAQTADWLTATYGATVVVSVSTSVAEKKIAEEICTASKHRIINLAEKPVTVGELKALFALADLVITNDTGPRHIATALGRKVIALFGPNDPAWTETGCENEIKIVGKAPCAPCAKPVCKEKKHLCMEAITVEMVCSAAEKLLENSRPQLSSAVRQNFVEVSNSFFIDADFVHPLRELGLTSIGDVFSFDAGYNLTKNNLAAFRTRSQFELKSSPTTLFLKRYDSPPLLSQLKNWWCHHCRISYGFCEVDAARKLTAAGISTPKIISYGWQCGTLFEKRSFCLTEKIPNAESLERKLPCCFSNPRTSKALKPRRDFIARLAAFVRNFHATGLRHRDLYFSHIFYSNNCRFYLIDLTRVFKPLILDERFRIKDIAQLYYSAPGQYFSRTDRLRFYLEYTGRSKLTGKDKIFIRRVISKTQRMARHNAKHGGPVPFAAKPANT